jgi:cell wall-associated NlpC family hydrolase
MALTNGDALVRTFRQYEYVRYAWSGNSPDTGWDCSGAINWVCGFKYKLLIPGFGAGQYGPGSGHGPVVQDWIQWTGVTKGVFGPVKPAAGDLIAWGPNVHMGMAINGSRFVSAANPSAGTIEADIGSFFTWAPYVLRLLQVRTGASLPSLPGAPGPGRDDYSHKVHNSASNVRAASVDAMRFGIGMYHVRTGR